MKKITAILLVLLLALTCVTMAACNKFDTEGAQKALDLYIFEQEGQVVSGEFVLPGTIGGFATTWTSSSDVITLTEVPADEANGIERQYTVKVGYPEEVTDVVLTVALSDDVKKSYTVTVNPVSVHDFISAYTFLNDKGTVVADFALDQTCTYAGKTATIAWSVDSEYADYIEISADGKTCIVYPTSLNPTVRIKATFTYNGETATKTFRMTVSEEKEHLQAVDYWYSNTDVGMTMVGYVVEIATEYNSSYQNVSLYIVDEDFCAGYYLYRVKCDDITASQLVPGAPVIVTGTMNTNYSGLMETNAGGTIQIDSDRTAVNVREHVYAIDNEIIGGLFSANYHQSSLVSLTNWTVKEDMVVPDGKSSTQTLFVLTKGGVEVPVVVSKYHEGSYKRDNSDPVYKAILELGLKKGDVVSITGLLGNYNGHQIALLSASDVKKGGTADAEGTTYPGVKAADAVKAVDDVLEAAGIENIIAAPKSITLPTVDGATIEAVVLGGSRAVEVEGNAIVITPGKLENACVRINITVGEFKTAIFRYIQSADLDNAGKLAMEKDAFELELKEVVRNSTIELPATGSIFSDIAVAWSFKDGTAPAFATLNGATLTVTLPEEAATITLVATLSLGEATPVTKEFTISVAKAEEKVLVVVDAPVGGSEYYFMLEQGNLDNINLFITGAMDGFYYATTEDVASAVKVKVVDLGEGKYNLMVGAKYLDVIANGTYINVVFVDAQPSKAFTWNAEHKTFVANVDGTDYIYGTRNDKEYKTFSACKLSGASNTFVAHLYEYGEATDAPELTPSIVSTPVNNEEYYFMLTQGNLDNINLFITGAMDGFYYATTEDVASAVKVKVVDLGEGKYNLMVGAKYLDIIANGTYINVVFVDAQPSKAFTWNAEHKTFVANVDGTDYIYGTRNDKEYKTFSACKLSGASNTFVAHLVELVEGAPECNHTYDNDCDASCNLCGETRTVGGHVDANTDNKCDSCDKDLTPPATIPAPADGTYKMFVVQAKLSKTLYFAGEINSDEHCTATDIADSAAIITITKTGDNAYTLKFGEKFLEIYINGAGKSRARLVDTANGTWAWDSTIGIFTWTVDSTAYYLGTFDENAIIRASALSYITGDNASKLGVSQFVCQYEAATPSSHTHTYVWTDNGDGTCSAVCSEDATHTLVAREHADSDKNYVCDNCGATLEAPAPVECPLVVGTGYTISAANANGTIYFVGTATDGRFDGTLTAEDAAVVYIENAANAGEYYLYMTDGTTKTYIVMDDKSAGAALTTDVTKASVFEWNADKSTLAVAEDSNNRAFGAGATSTYNNFSCYDLSGSYNWGQFTAVESSEPACEHVYDNVHDNECNLCGDPNPDYVADCDFDNVHDNECNLCGGANPDYVADCGFDNVHDNECNLCGGANPDYVADCDFDNVHDNECSLCGGANPDYVADCDFDNVHDNECSLCGGANPNYVADHDYTNECDGECDLCQAPRENTPHMWAGDCDAECECGATRAPLANHTDDNADNACDVCGATITPYCEGEHTYDDECDANCNACPFVRTELAHAWASECDTECRCGAETREGNGAHEYADECAEACTLCGFVRAEIPHKYENACDAECECGATRTPADHVDTAEVDCKCDECGADLEHAYDNACDAECNVCGEPNPNFAGHQYDNACDADCNVCLATREVTHTYDNACDADCNVCSDARTPADHVDTAEADCKCDECGAYLEHTWANACDAECDLCHETREVTHAYDNDCDAECNVCSATREVTHTYDNNCDADCNVCGAENPSYGHHVDVTNGFCDECFIAVEIGAAIGAEDGTKAELTGTVKSIASANSNDTAFYLTDGTNDLYIYNANIKGIGAGDNVTVIGTMATYNGARQIAKGSTVIVNEKHTECTSFTDADCENAAKCVACGKANGIALGHEDGNEDGECDRCFAEMSAMPVATFTFGENGAATHADGSDMKEATATYTDGDYTLTFTDYSKVYTGSFDATGKSCIKLGTSKLVGSFKFTAPEDVNKVVIYVAKYKASATKININGNDYTINTASNDGEYTAIEIDVSTNKQVTFTTVATNYRCMIDAIEFYA